MKKVYLFIILLLLTGFQASFSYAGVLKGKVTDEKGIPLPFATIYLQGTTMGVSANDNGIYELEVAPGSYKVLCQSMGYKQVVFELTISGGETVSHDFKLQGQSYEMKEVVVKEKEDPAYEMIRKTIARRKFHLQQVKAFQSGIYMKGVLRNRKMPTSIMGISINLDDSSTRQSMEESGLDSVGKGVLYLCEEEANYYAKEPNEQKTIIKSVRQSGDPKGMGFAEMLPVITFYENNVNLLSGYNPRGFISPISDNALFYYRYKYEGTYQQGDYTIHKITVIPRRQYEPLLQGTIYIVEGDWALHNVDLVVTKKYGLEFLDTIHIKQTYLSLKEDTWVIKNQVFYPTLTVLGFDIGGVFLTSYSDQKVNEPIPDTIFSKKIVSIYEKGANQKDTAYWTKSRPVPLQKDEIKNYKVQDSIYEKHNTPGYRDSMRKRGNRITISGLLLNGLSQRTKDNRDHISTTSPIINWVNFNSVEGLNIAPRVYWMRRLDTGQVLSMKAGFRYGFSNHHFNGIGEIGYTSRSQDWRGKYWRISALGGKYVYQFNSLKPISEEFNTASTLFYKENYMKIYEGTRGAIGLARNYGNGFKWSVGGMYEQRSPLLNTTKYAWVSNRDSFYTDNNAIKTHDPYIWEKHDAFKLRASISYQPGFTYVKYPDYLLPISGEKPVFTLNYEKGIPGILNSKADFDKWNFNISGKFDLKLLGGIGYNVSVGGFLNKNYVSLPDMMHILDNQLVLAQSPYLGSFQLAPYYKYSNTAPLYSEVHVEYNLMGLLTNKIPLFRQARWYALVGTNTLYAGQNNYYTEAFVGLDNLGLGIYRIFRVDLVQSWDNTGDKHIGIRIGIKAGPGLNVSVRNSSDEW